MLQVAQESSMPHAQFLRRLRTRKVDELLVREAQIVSLDIPMTNPTSFDSLLPSGSLCFIR
jgi:hypothetical protein